ncbi:MAG: BT4734/BF3469 family protein [Prolixibacteraceae bacterium]
MDNNIKNINQKFSFFLHPVTQTKKPHADITLSQVYQVINETYHKEITEQLRSISDKKENRKFKALNFNYVTFSGTFSKRGAENLIQHSGFMVLDFDNLADVEAVKLQLLKDPCFETQLLFISPNGNGLKWVIEIDINGKYSHGQWFDAVRNYIKSTHGIEVDKSGRDVCRVCFISYDPTAYIHPKYLIDE